MVVIIYLTIIIYQMNNQPDKDLYDPKEVQVFKNIRGDLHYFDLFIISLFACPSFTKRINKYIKKNFNIPVLHKIINNEANGEEKTIYLVFFEIINDYGPFAYYEFVFLLFYIIYQKAKLLSNIIVDVRSNYIKICIKLLYICLLFYYYSKLSYSATDMKIITKSFEHRPYNLLLDDTFNEDYLLDFIGQKYLIPFDINYTIMFRTFVNFLRDAAQFNKKMSSISNLFGNIIYQFDLRVRLLTPSHYIYDASKILIVFDHSYGSPDILKKYKDTGRIYRIKFPKFINYNVQVKKKNFTAVKSLQYVLVIVYFTLDSKSVLNGNIVARFYEDNKQKYFRINNNDIIECGNNEKLLSGDIITRYTPPFFNRCDNVEDFDEYAIMGIYHAYKWL